MSMTLSLDSGSLWMLTLTSGLISLMEAAADSALGRPTSDCPWITWRCRLDSSTTSKSMTPRVPTPAAARYSRAGEPRPPAPTHSTLAFFRRFCPAIPASGMFWWRVLRRSSSLVCLSVGLSWGGNDTVSPVRARDCPDGHRSPRPASSPGDNSPIRPVIPRETAAHRRHAGVGTADQHRSLDSGHIGAVPSQRGDAEMSLIDKVKNRLHMAKGRTKEETGRMPRDRDLEARGRGVRALGGALLVGVLLLVLGCVFRKSFRKCAL